MSASKGYYSLIQYCPDLGRRESVNIGVLLLCPERRFLKALTDRGLKRVCSCLAPTSADRYRVEALRESIERRLRAEARNIHDLDDLKAFVTSRGNAIQLTEPRPMKVYNAEEDLRTLFEQLVEPPTPAFAFHSPNLPQVAQATLIGDLLSPTQGSGYPRQRRMAEPSELFALAGNEAGGHGAGSFHRPDSTGWASFVGLGLEGDGARLER